MTISVVGPFDLLTPAVADTAAGVFTKGGWCDFTS